MTRTLLAESLRSRKIEGDSFRRVVARRLIFWSSSILMFPGFFSTYFPRPFLTSSSAQIATDRNVPHRWYFDLILWYLFKQFDRCISFSGYSHINQQALLQHFVLYQGHGNDVRPFGFDFFIGMSWNASEDSWIVHVSCSFSVTVSGVCSYHLSATLMLYSLQIIPVDVRGRLIVSI